MANQSSMTEPQPSDSTDPTDPIREREREYFERDRRLRENHRRRKFVDMVGSLEKFDEMTFANFDRSRAPAAYDAAMAFNPQNQNLYFWGPSRVGKSHLATAIARREFEKGSSVQIIRMDQFKDRIHLYESKFRYEEKIKFLSDLATAKILVIHEMSRGNVVSPLIQEAFLSIIEDRILSHRNGLIGTSQFPLKHVGEIYGGSVLERIREMCGPFGIILFPPKQTGGHA